MAAAVTTRVDYPKPQPYRYGDHEHTFAMATGMAITSACCGGSTRGYSFRLGNGFKPKPTAKHEVRKTESFPKPKP